MKDPTPADLNALPPEAFWTPSRAGIARSCDIVKTDSTAKRQEQLRKADTALRELELSALTRADKDRVYRATRALHVLDEERALLEVENDRLRAALASLPPAGREGGGEP